MMMMMITVIIIIIIINGKKKTYSGAEQSDKLYSKTLHKISWGRGVDGTIYRI